MFPELNITIEKFSKSDIIIPEERKGKIKALAELIKNKQSEGVSLLNFICTHNSRRSQIAEVWLRTFIKHFDIRGLETCSSGTESTVFNPNAIAALVKVGFQATIMEDGPNPRYLISYGIDEENIPLMYSLTFDEIRKENRDFLAIMVCSDADQNCPFIPGVSRFSLTYEDPKVADDRPDKEQVYKNKVMEIGNEMYLLASLLKDSQT